MIDRSDNEMSMNSQIVYSKRFNEALELCKKILDSDGKSMVALNVMGVLADKKGQLEESVKFICESDEFELNVLIVTVMLHTCLES